jgi:hypothetical protein
MATCLICKKTCELHNGYYGFYEKGWLAIEIKSLANGYIGTHKADICPDCKPLSFDKIFENVKKPT